MANPSGKGGFKSGQSGNPGGRPKKEHTLSDALKTVLRAKGEDGKQNKKAIAEKLVKMARSGDTKAMGLIFERTEGKVPETRVLQGAEDAPPIRYIEVAGD